MSELTLVTWDWVPEEPRGYVRDLRVRWALEEAGLPYRVESVTPDDQARHLKHQPFAQVPYLTDGDISIFESGAILLYLGDRSEALMPTEAIARAKALSWVVAALNTMETAILPWVALTMAEDSFAAPGAQSLMDIQGQRLRHLEVVLAKGEWLAGRFSAADILMSDALRLFDGSEVLTGYPACRDYVARATARSAFCKAYTDQLAHFAAEDARRAAVS